MEMLLQLLNLAPSLAIAILFIWYDKQHQVQWRAERQEMQTQFMQFLADQRSATLATLDVMAMRLQQLGDVIMGMDDRTKRFENTFDQHDTRAENIGIAVAEIRAKINGKAQGQLEQKQSEAK